MSRNTLTADNLRSALWETLQAVKAKKIKPNEANAVAAQSREIMRTVKMQLDVMKHTGKSTDMFLLQAPIAPKAKRGRPALNA